MEAQTTPRDAKKRPADDPLEGEQRLSKRFNLLSLEQNGKLFIPVNGHSPPPPPPSPAPLSNPRPSRERLQRTRADDDWMQVEDTKDKIYIHNLDDELASEEDVPEDERIIFLPDIEKQLAKIPDHILRGDTESPRNLGTQLVLYSVPRSITVPEEKDNVRKAIIESRARARLEQEAQSEAASASQDSMLHDDEQDQDTAGQGFPSDPDAMDIG
ncbi:hypothetical protein FH972_025810 [Carpinus fangiana]|uniref:Uncharacterized protein n=1 Tax=Carpinus fangiana TaxID=176857 RepID=A0A5N6L2I0_9ROSI|nr:hypothetical protein FH972_025810 [Carpinus fangiana]